MRNYSIDVLHKKVESMSYIADADVPKIEVTPEMIEAGLSELYGYNPDRSELTAEETVEAIYCLMEKVRLRDQSSGGYIGKVLLNVN